MSALLKPLKFILDMLEHILKGPKVIWYFIFAFIAIYNLPFEQAWKNIIHIDKVKASILFPDWNEFNNVLVFLHIAAAIPATFLGPLMFLAPYRKAYPKHHRWIGTVYAIGCMISALTVFPVALANKAGFISHLGFGMMAVVWFFVTYWAYAAARNKNYVAHRRWMMRSYAMTFAFIHVNFTYHLIGVYTGVFSVDGVKIFQSMISWMSDLMIVELYLAATAVNGRWLGFQKWFYNLTHLSSLDKIYWSVSKPKKPSASLGSTSSANS